MSTKMSKINLTHCLIISGSPGLRKTSSNSAKCSPTKKILFKVKGAHKTITKALKGRQPAPMTHLTRTKDQGQGTPKGSITSNPKEIDELLHEVWDPITEGNTEDPLTAARDFLQKYDAHIFKALAYHVEAITPEELKKQCQHDIGSAPGLDGWAACDSELLSAGSQMGPLGQKPCWPLGRSSCQKTYKTFRIPSPIES